MKNILSSAIADAARTLVLISVITLGCTVVDTNVPQPGKPTARSITIEPDRLNSMVSSESRPLTAVALDSAGQPIVGKSIVWTSADIRVATVSSAGVVTAIATGSTTVTAAADAAAGHVAVTVVESRAAAAVRVIDSTKTRLVSDSVLDAAGTLTFVGQAPPIKTGDVVVAPQGDGLIRRIESVVRNGNTTTATSIPAALHEAVDAGSFSSSVGAGISNFRWLPPRVIGPNPASVDFSPTGWTFDGLRLSGRYCPGSSPTIDTCVDASVAARTARVSFTGTSPTVAFDMGWTGLKRFQFLLNGNLSLDADLEFQFAISGKSSLKCSILKSQSSGASDRCPGYVKNLLKVQYPFAGSIGIVPVVGSVVFDLEAELTFGVEASLEAQIGGTATAPVSAGIDWQPGSSNIFRFDAPISVQTRTPSMALSAKGEVRLGLKPRVYLVLYGLRTAFFEIDPYLRAAIVATPPTYGFESYFGIQVSTGIELAILDKVIARTATTFGPYEKRLAAFTTGPAPLVVTNSASSITTSGFVASGSFDPRGSQTTGWFEYGTNPALAGATPTASFSVGGAGTPAVTIPRSITGLNPSTVYFFRAVASNASGTTRGQILSVTTTGGTGALNVTNTITGPMQPAGPFTVTVDPGTNPPVTQTIPKGGSVTLSGLAPGSHVVQLEGPGIGSGSNCMVTGGSTRTVVIFGASTASLTFGIVCTTVHTVGDLTVANSVSGPNQPAGPFLATLDAGGSSPLSKLIPKGGSVVFPGVSVGSHDVTLTGTGIGSNTNCPITGGSSRSVNVTSSGMVSTTFVVVCASAPSTVGDLTVVNAISGPNQPAGPFTVTLDAPGSSPVTRSIPRGGSAVFSGIAAGSHDVRLTGTGIGTGSNCPITGGFSRTVDVPAGGAVTTSFAIVCSSIAPTVGDLTVTNSISGSSQPAGPFSVTLDTPGNSPVTKSIPKGGSVVFAGIAAGSHDVRLSGSGIGTNSTCPITGGFSRMVDVPAGGAITTSFAIVCSPSTPTVGDLTVTNTISGSNQPAGPFTVILDAPGSSPVTKSISKGGSVVFSGIAAGSHDVRLTGNGIGTNSTCPITGGFSRTVDVPAGGQITTAFDIVCSSQAPTVTTQAASSITAIGFQMNGTINPNGVATQGYFEWSASPSLSGPSSSGMASMGAGTSPVNLVSPLGVGTCNTTFYYRAVAVPAGGSAVRGSIVAGTTASCPSAPTVTTKAASNVTTTGFQMNGTINPNGAATQGYFEWSASPTLSGPSSSGMASMGAGTSPVNLVSPLGVGTCNTTFYYRAVAVPTGGSAVRGSIIAGTTASCPTSPPTVTTTAASNITTTSFQMNGTINPNGVATQGYFEWGTSSTLSSASVTGSASVGSGTSAVGLTSTPLIVGACNATYYFRTVAAPTGGSAVRGSIRSVTTAACTPTLSITTSSMPSATLGTGYGQGIGVSGGRAPYTWSASGGLPPGLSINSAFGSIFGTPTARGTFTFNVTVRDASSPQQSVSRSISLTVR